MCERFFQFGGLCKSILRFHTQRTARIMTNHKPTKEIAQWQLCPLPAFVLCTADITRRTCCRWTLGSKEKLKRPQPSPLTRLPCRSPPGDDKGRPCLTFSTLRHFSFQLQETRTYLINPSGGLHAVSCNFWFARCSEVKLYQSLVQQAGDTAK